MFDKKKYITEYDLKPENKERKRSYNAKRNARLRDERARAKEVQNESGTKTNIN